jgi:ribulose 1,5-bisphosphate carboxylase large subunit-like protein
MSCAIKSKLGLSVKNYDRVGCEYLRGGDDDIILRNKKGKLAYIRYESKYDHQHPR